MRCPLCKSNKFYIREDDPTLMDCEDCHNVCSVSYAKGFWIGYLEAKQASQSDASQPNP